MAVDAHHNTAPKELPQLKDASRGSKEQDYRSQGKGTAFEKCRLTISSGHRTSRRSSTAVAGATRFLEAALVSY